MSDEQDKPLTVETVLARGWLGCRNKRADGALCLALRAVDKAGWIESCAKCGDGGSYVRTQMTDRRGNPIKQIQRSRKALKEPAEGRNLSREQQRRARQMERARRKA